MTGGRKTTVLETPDKGLEEILENIDQSLELYDNLKCSLTKEENLNNTDITPGSLNSTPLNEKQINLKKEEERLLSLKEKHFGKPLLWPQLLVALAGASLHLQFGVIMAFTSVVIPILSDPNSTDIYLNKDELALFCSINTIGTVFRAFVSGFIITKIGQRITIMLLIPLGVSGWILLAYSTNFTSLIISRICVGIVLGIGESSANSFIVEVAHTSVRGRLMALLDVVRPLGFLYVSAIGSTNLHWQNVGLFCGLSTLVLPFFITIFIPNSPRWIATHGRRKEATKSLVFYRGQNYNVDKEIEDIFSQLRQTPNSGKIFEQIKLFKNRKIGRIFLILSVMMFCVHLTGNIVTIAYTVSIFKDAETSVNVYLSAIIVSAVRIIGSAANLLISDRFKRKNMILPAMLISTISIASLGFYFYSIQFYDTANISWMPLPIMIVFVFSTTFYIPSFQIIRSELLPTAIRSIGNGIHYVLFSTSMFIALFSFPYIVESIGYHWAFWICVLDSVILLIIIYFLVPETKGKTLEEIANDI